MKKRIMMFSSVTALVTLLVAGGTMAWFTSNPEAVNNEFEAGTVNIGINENRFQNIKNWNPGQTSTKDVDITIDSSKQTYVRVKLTPSWGGDLALDHVAINLHLNTLVDYSKRGIKETNAAQNVAQLLQG